LHVTIWSISSILSIPEALSLKFLTYAGVLTFIWIFPIIAIYLSSLVLYAVLIIKIRRAESENLTLSILSASRFLAIRVILYQMVFIFCWVSGFILWISYGIRGCFTDPCETILSTAWQLAGLFNAIVFTTTNKQVTRFNFYDWVALVFAPLTVLPHLILFYIDQRNTNELTETSGSINNAIGLTTSLL